MRSFLWLGLEEDLTTLTVYWLFVTVLFTIDREDARSVSSVEQFVIYSDVNDLGYSFFS
jgi:hypothetical protein